MPHYFMSATKFHLYMLILMVFIAYKNQKASVNHEQQAATTKIVQAFNSLNSEAQVITYSNPLEVNHQGGHIQGVQWMKKGERTYAVMTGSSSTYSYYAVMRLGAENEVILVNKILDKPLKHAGGSQIHAHYMAVGIEDNEARNISRVHLYDISDPEQPPQAPIAVIERTGAYERATAGCVGMTMVDHKILLVVGDWSSRHLDFYLSETPADETKPLAFEKVYTINVADMGREGWINQEWLSYQNINLLQSEENKLYMVGLARNDEAKDVADLFEVETATLEEFKLTKVASKTFQAKGGTNFQWAAGVHYDPLEGKMHIISTTDHLDGQSVLNLFR